MDEEAFRNWLEQQNSTYTSPATSQTQSQPSYLPQYHRAVSALNGLMFLMLALTVLNYGSRLETLISSTAKKKEAVYVLADDSGKRLSTQRRMLESSSDYLTLNLNDHGKKVLNGLDQRIFNITIGFTLLFFIVSVIEFLTAWDVISKAQDTLRIVLVSAFRFCAQKLVSTSFAWRSFLPS